MAQLTLDYVLGMVNHCSTPFRQLLTSSTRTLSVSLRTWFVNDKLMIRPRSFPRIHLERIRRQNANFHRRRMGSDQGIF
jgi:hypothetical protein